MCRFISWVVGKECLLWPVCCLAKTVHLCPASFCIPRPNLPVTPGISWLPTFAFQSPMMKRTSFLVLVLEGLVGLHITVQLQLLWHYWLEHRLGLLWYWMVCLGSKPRLFCFWDCTQALHFRLFCWLWGQQSLRRNGVALIVNKKVRNAVFGCSLKTTDDLCSLSMANHSISQ